MYSKYSITKEGNKKECFSMTQNTNMTEKKEGLAWKPKCQESDEWVKKSEDQGTQAEDMYYAL